MTHRVAGVLLVVALVSAGGSEPFARVPQNRPSPRSRLVVGASTRSVAQPDQQGHAQGTTTLVGDRPQHLSATLSAVAVAHPSIRVGAAPALVERRVDGRVPDPPGQPVPVAANIRPSRQPRVVLAARAPPV